MIVTWYDALAGPLRWRNVLVWVLLFLRMPVWSLRQICRHANAQIEICRFLAIGRNSTPRWYVAYLWHYTVRYTRPDLLIAANSAKAEPTNHERSLSVSRVKLSLQKSRGQKKKNSFAAAVGSTSFFHVSPRFFPTRPGFPWEKGTVQIKAFCTAESAVGKKKSSPPPKKKHWSRDGHGASTLRRALVFRITGICVRMFVHLRTLVLLGQCLATCTLQRRKCWESF